MASCEEAFFIASFTAGTQTASNIVFTVTVPNTGFSYVAGSGLITLPDGSIVSAEPSPSGFDLIWYIDQILEEAYELPPGETLMLKFALGTGCGTISGTLVAHVDYQEGGSPSYLTDSQSIEILPGAVRISKEPTVIAAEVGDTVTWTITVENTGLGPIYNVVVTDVLGLGLGYVDSSPAGVVTDQT
ncbi:MAG: DUF11 domain-containing protein, partial [Clostridia bacterium]|nr:DUF11 domain-containing protein [Clostridia bacterium]